MLTLKNILMQYSRTLTIDISIMKIVLHAKTMNTFSRLPFSYLVEENHDSKRSAQVSSSTGKNFKEAKEGKCVDEKNKI